MCVDIQIHESGTNYFAFWVGIHFSVTRIHYISTCPQQQIMNTVHEIRIFTVVFIWCCCGFIICGIGFVSNDDGYSLVRESGIQKNE
jgi:hypothetical protein